MQLDDESGDAIERYRAADRAFSSWSCSDHSLRSRLSVHMPWLGECGFETQNMGFHVKDQTVRVHINTLFSLSSISRCLNWCNPEFGVSVGGARS